MYSNHRLILKCSSEKEFQFLKKGNQNKFEWSCNLILSYDVFLLMIFHNQLF